MTTPDRPPQHYHAFECLVRVRAPTGPEPEHTVFFVMACDCLAVEVFPRANYDLTTDEYRERFDAWLRFLGLRWA